MKEKFDVYITFVSKDQTVEHHTEDTLLRALERLTRGPAAQMGLIHEVKVVDTMDCTNFLFRDGEVLFPPRR